MNPLLLPVVVAGAVAFDTLGPVRRRLRVLSPVAENFRQFVQGGLAISALRILREPLVDPHVIEFVRQRKTPDAGCQLGNGFVAVQRVELEGAADVLFDIGLPRPRPVEEPSVLRHGLHAELSVQEFGKRPCDIVCDTRIDRLRPVQEPAPTFPVRPRRLERFRHVVVHGISLFIDRRAGGGFAMAPPVVVPLFVVRQLAGVAQRVELPRAVLATASQNLRGVC